MKAFFHVIFPDGNTRLGTLDAMASKEYKTLSGITKAAKDYANAKKSPVKVELFYNWGNRYGNADKVFTVIPNLYDDDYSIQSAWSGHEKPTWMVWFRGDYVNNFFTLESAYWFVVQYEENRQKSLRNCA